MLNPNPFVQAFLLLRSHAAFRGACRLALSGQAAETFVVIRSCLEHALYALHIHKDPALAEVWLGRHDGNDERSRKAVRNAFQHAKVMATLEKTDRRLHERIARLYEQTDFGAHPNERGLTGNMKLTESPGKAEYLNVYLHEDGLPLEHALMATARCGLGSLLVFRFIYRERFMLLGLSARIDQLRAGM